MSIKNKNYDMETVALNFIFQSTSRLNPNVTNGSSQNSNSVWNSYYSVNNPQEPYQTVTQHESTPEPQEPENKTDNEIKQDVLNILKNNPNVKIDFESEGGQMLLDIAVKKYNAMKAIKPNITEEEVSRRLGNYINGYIYHTGENIFGTQSLGEAINIDSGYSNFEMVNPDIRDAVNNGNMDAYQAAFRQQAKEYIEFYDENGDGKIDLAELVMSEINETQNELKRNLTDEEKNAIKEMAMTKIATLDKDNDNKLNENEIAGYHWARNNLHGKGYSMTYQEFDEFETSMFKWRTLTPEEIEKGNLCAAVLKKYGLKVGSLDQDLSKYGFTQEDYETITEGLEFLKVSVALQAYDNGYQGFKQ